MKAALKHVENWCSDPGLGKNPVRSLLEVGSEVCTSYDTVRGLGTQSTKTMCCDGTYDQVLSSIASTSARTHSPLHN